jgi:serine/threonine-protein kinase
MSTIDAIETQSFGRYDLLGKLGRGGMATLYLARLKGPLRFQKLLAIKKIHPHLAAQTEFIHMFLDEARIVSRIDHPNVAAVFEMGKQDGDYFLAMEYIHGENLAAVLKTSVHTGNVLPWPLAVHLVAQAAAGLHSAHQCKDASGRSLGVVHRDVSPQNLLVSYTGHLKVVDFGVAFAREKLSQTATHQTKGKIGYLAPEQLAGVPVDRRTDIFALGTVLWESLCAKRLFRAGSEAETLDRIHHMHVPSPRKFRPELPNPLAALVLQCLSKKPSKRPPTAEVLETELKKILLNSGQVVGGAKVAAFLQQHTSDQKEQKERFIQKALSTATEAQEHTETHPRHRTPGSDREFDALTRVATRQDVTQTKIFFGAAEAPTAEDSAAEAPTAEDSATADPTAEDWAGEARNVNDSAAESSAAGDRGAARFSATPAEGPKPFGNFTEAPGGPTKPPFPGASKQRARDRKQKSAPKSRIHLEHVWATIAALSLSGLVLLLVLWSPWETQTAPHSSGAKTAQNANTAASTVRITVEALPREVKPTFTFRGQTYKGRVFQITTRPGRKRREPLRVTAPGYQPQILTITADRDVRRTIRLKESGSKPHCRQPPTRQPPTRQPPTRQPRNEGGKTKAPRARRGAPTGGRRRRPSGRRPGRRTTDITKNLQDLPPE